MKIKRIEFAPEMTDPPMDNSDVFVENEARENQFYQT